MRAVAFRGLDIPIYPPHPDLWDDAETLPLLEDGQGFGLWAGSVDAYNCYGSCPIVHEPADGAIVPYDAEAVEVTLTPGDDRLTDIGLKFHAADARGSIDLTPTQATGKTRVYVIPVTPGMGDSPYATQSQWQFAPYVSSPERDSIHAGSYAISARVVRRV